MTEIEIKNRLDPLLKDLATHKNLETVEIVISELMKLIDVETNERELLDITKIDNEIHRFQPAPLFLKQAAAYKIPNNKNNYLDLKLYWLKNTTKTNLSWIVGLTPNFEDSAANDFANIGIDFAVPESGDSLIILLSQQYKIRSLEIKDHITSTQAEIFKAWSSIKHTTDEDITSVKASFHGKLWETFNFEPINKKFYLELVESFSLLTHHLEKDFGKKSSVMFTTRLIGRLLFIWFLKKKGLINSHTNYFDINKYTNQNDFYRNALEVLFFNVLNQEISSRINDDKSTPYLNGGLFDINSTDFFNDPKLTFPNGFFNHLFDTLNKYNFTVDESSPEFQHVAIDPEMLGRIFESLLAEQVDETTGKDKKKQTGAFYTPRDIVSYMCEESLIEFLKFKLPFSPDRDRKIEELIRLPETIFRDQDSNKRRDWKPYSESIIKALDGSDANNPITILDPAVGSGAFPMGMLHLLVKVFSRLDVKYEKNVSHLKRVILSKSLYGVDIEQTAIEICRLRAWLSIIVDIAPGDLIEPLPNLDFKFVCANTLVPLSEIKQESLLNDPNLKDKLMVIRDKYFNTVSKTEKIKLQNEYLKLTHNEGLFDDEKTKQLKSYQPFKVDASSTFYDPELHHGVSNFDIIIGNPPYGVSIKDDYRKNVVKKLGKVPDFEIYYYFIELAYNRLKPSGINSYILPNTFLFNVFAETYREKLLTNWSTKCILDCTAFKLFDSATVFNAITLLTKENSENNNIGYKPTAFAKNFAELSNRKTLLLSRDSVIEGNKNWSLLFKLNQKVSSLTKKIRQNKNLITDLFDVSQGCIPYRRSDLIKTYGEIEGNKIVDQRLWHSTFKVEEDFKPELFGENLSRFAYKAPSSFLKYGKHLAGYVDIKYFNQPRVLVREITNPYIIASFVEEEFINDPQIINIIPKKTAADLKFILGILNSKLATFYHFNSSPKASKGGFPKILVTDIKNFPIPEITEQEKESFVKIVNEILILKKSNSDISLLENKIDNMVYTFYKISVDEIKTIEGLDEEQIKV